MTISAKVKLQDLISSPGHHHYFLTDPYVREDLRLARDSIRSRGLPAYVLREYPPNKEKRIIINRIENRFFVVDGNKHLTAMLLALPGLCVADLQCICPDLIRFWDRGIEHEGEQVIPYEIYIPTHIDTSALREVRIGYDNFKWVPHVTKIIPADIPFDSPLFSGVDRGLPLSRTVAALRSDDVFCL